MQIAAPVLDGGSGTLSALDRPGTPFAIVTNDASRLPATYAARFARHGIRLAAERVVTSGSLLPAYFRDHGLVGAPTYGAADGGATSASLGSIVGSGSSEAVSQATSRSSSARSSPRTRDAPVAQGELVVILDVRHYFCVIRRGHVQAGTKTRSRVLERLRAVAARGDENGVRATIASYGAIWRFGP